jgi:hypothetical protein
MTICGQYGMFIENLLAEFGIDDLDEPEVEFVVESWFLGMPVETTIGHIIRIRLEMREEERAA